MLNYTRLLYSTRPSGLRPLFCTAKAPSRQNTRQDRFHQKKFALIPGFHRPSSPSALRWKMQSSSCVRSSFTPSACTALVAGAMPPKTLGGRTQFLFQCPPFQMLFTASISHLPLLASGVVPISASSSCAAETIIPSSISHRLF